MEFLRVSGRQIVDAKGKKVRLRGTCPGGWMNMEDFINGHPGAEHTLRAQMAEVLGPARAQFFFERLLDHFFNERRCHLSAEGWRFCRQDSSQLPAL